MKIGQLPGNYHLWDRDDESTGVDSDEKSTGVKQESGIMGATDKVDKMALIEEAITEPERDISEGT